MKKLFLVVVMVLGICVNYVGATSIDFAAIPPWDGTSSNEGTSLIFGNLTITAKSGLLPADDPLFVADKAGTIYWGDLGDLNAGSMHEIGLGVQTASAGGSKGISGDGGDAQEALIFLFANPPVDSGSVMLTLIGINGGTRNADVIELAFEFFPLENPSDVIIASYAFSTSTGTITIDFGTDPQLSAIPGHTFGSFAVEAVDGHFGVGGIEYTESIPVPEPATMLLLGSGLIGLGGYWRRRAKSTRS